MSTESVDAGGVPEFQQHHRLGLALEFAGIGVGEMAEYLDVGRSTISRWLNGRGGVKLQVLRLWALKTGVPLTWLQTGQRPTYAVRD